MWDIKFNSNDIHDIKYYLQQHDIFSSSICFYDENNKSNGGYFSAIRHIDNSVFQCEIRKDTSKSILTVIYHKPLTGKDLSTSIKQHEIREAEQKEYNELNKR